MCEDTEREDQVYVCVWGDGYVESTSTEPTVEVKDLDWFDNDRGYDDTMIKDVNALGVGESITIFDPSGEHFVMRVN